MSLAAGIRLGPYEVVAPIGAGGMGEVYRARDVRLDRIVAIKTLPSHLADQPARRDRFEREARAVAALNHPNIATLHDIGVEGDIRFIAMELVEGESLAQRLEKGPLPLAQALRYTAEIADALSQAHRHGITHRDLKPSNIMLTKGGAKLLDFGLAKMHNLESSSFTIPVSDLATTPAQLTIDGAILGTVHYMAPEQLLGKAVDARTDIFALGAVIHEMLTGEKAFRGKTAVSLMVAIMEHEPVSIPSLVPSVPLTVSQIVRKCLAKEPEERWQSAQDLRDTVRLLAEPRQEAAAPAIRSRRRFLIEVFLALAALVGVLALFRGRRKSAYPADPQLQITAPPDTIFSGAPADLNISPDSRYVVFGARGTDGNQSLWLRPTDSLKARRLDGTENAFAPFWSFDSTEIAFFAEGKLKRLTVVGEATEVAKTICGDVPEGRGGAWNEDGDIVFARNLTGPLYRVSARRSEPASPLTTLDKEQSGHIWPQFLDNNRYVYLGWNDQKNKRRILMNSLSAPAPKEILAADSNITFALGHLIFSQDGQLKAQPFDPSAGETTGGARILDEDVWRNPSTGRAAFAVSQSGVLVYRNGANFGATQLVVRDRAGKVVRDREGKELRLGDGGGYGNPMVSSNELIALDVQDAKNDTRSIFTMTLKGDLNPITTGASTDSSALLSRDSQQILYLSNLPEPAIHIKNLGNGKEESVPAKGVLNIQAWSEPLQSIILGKLDKDTGRDLYIYSLKDGKLDGGEMVPFLTDAYNQIHAQISPDGNWIVYASDEINGYQVYLQKFPGLGFKQQISTGLGGIQPQWNPNGNEVFYLAPDRRLMSVAIVDSDSGGKKGETPQPLFRTEVSGPNALHARNNYSVYLDRRGEIRFVVNSVVDSKQPINVIAGWERKPR